MKLLKELWHRLGSFRPGVSIEKRLRFAPVGDHLYRAGQPNSTELNYLVKNYRLRSLIIVNEVSVSERAIAETLGLRILPLQLLSGVPPRESQIRAFFNWLANPKNRPALIHCSQGRDRTGCFCFIYRVELMDWTRQQAWQEMKNFGFLSLPWHHYTQRHIKTWLGEQYFT